MKTGAQRMAAQRARRKESGLQRFEFWLRPEHVEAVKRFIARLAKRRTSK